MSKKVFLDSDIVLDLLCKRPAFYEHAATLFTLADKGEIDLFTTPVVYANVFYILRKLLGIEKAKELLRKMRIVLHVTPVNEKVIDLSLNSAFSDFEDGIQYFSARENKIGVIITRNVSDYKEKDVLVQKPEEFLKAYRGKT